MVWDLEKIVAGCAPDVAMAQIAIDSTLESAHLQPHKRETQIVRKLERALSLAVSINDKTRIESVKNHILKYEETVAEDEKPGLWGFSFDLLFNNKKVDLPEQDKAKLIQDLKNRFKRLAAVPPKGYPGALESAALRLASHYRATNQAENLLRVMQVLRKAFEQASEDGSALQASFWLQHMHSLFLEYGLRAEAEEIAIKIKEVGSKAADEMHTASSEVTIADEEMKGYIEALLGNEFHQACINIAVHYIVKKGEVESQLKDLAAAAPLTFLVSRQIVDARGRPLASIGSLEDDPIGNIVSQASQNMDISAIFLRQVISEFISRFEITPQKLADYLCQSPVFDEDKRQIVTEGLTAYFERNDLVAIHLLVLQIESAIRRLVELIGGSVLKPSRAGGMHLKTLDELLRDDLLVSVLGEDTALYFRILLTDQRGWTVRNDVCHGIIPAMAFQARINDRLIHTLLCLALIRSKEQNQGQA